MVPEKMRRFLTGTHRISLKQVPSALVLKHGGSNSVNQNLPVLLDTGFDIEQYSSKEESKILFKDADAYWERPKSHSSVEDILDIESSIYTHSELSKDESAMLSDGWTKVEPKDKTNKKRTPLRIEYEDFFSIISGRFLADALDLENKPRVLVWGGDVKRLQDPLDTSFFEWKKHGRTIPKNKIRFQDIDSVEVQMEFLMRHTHWGAKLASLCKEENAIARGDQSLYEDSTVEPHSAHMLVKVIKCLLAGKPDPRWTNEFRDSIYICNDYRRREARSKNFLEVLKTVDGIFAQRLCAFPHEEWSYEKYDLFILNLIWELTSDVFIDGQLHKGVYDLSSRFGELKKARKAIKLASLTDWANLGTTELFNKKARWLRFLLPLYEGAKNEKDRLRQTYLIGTLAQTRGAGKPPPIVNLQSKVKFLQTVQLPDNTNDTALLLIRGVMGKIMKDLPDYIFTGLRTKASITVNTNATFEKTQKDMGTLAAVQEFCQMRETGEKAMTYCLETGVQAGYLDEDATPGEYIFWRALEETLWLSPQERRHVSLSTVDEPGKSRTITKGRACVKIVLDLVNKICAVPLAKGFSSSSSGMEASHHAWNLFKDFETEEFEDILFSGVGPDEKEYYTNFELVRRVYKTAFVTSTDYETATDFLSHKVGREIGTAWMTKCGIPKLLRDLVCEIAYGPRQIYFKGNLGVGTVVNAEENLYYIHSCRGILMGDPLTKIVLHFVNIVARAIAKWCRNSTLFVEAFGPIESIGTNAALSKALGLT